MANFRKGAEAVAKSTEKSKGGSYRSYAPSIFWQNDNDHRYLLFLNPMEEVVTADMVRYIPQVSVYKDSDGEEVTREYFEEVIARTDDSIGDSVDPMVRDWEGSAKPNGIAVAVELDPILEDENGYNRVRGFSVATHTFNRRIRDEDGDLTDDVEEVTTPNIGIITQSTFNFFNVVTSFDANDAPIDKCPVKITRVGSDSSTTYSIQGYQGVPVDLSALSDFVDGISYLNDEMDELIDLIDKAETDEEVASIIGQTVLDKRLDELVDEDRYDKLYDTIDKSLDRFGSKKAKKGKGKAAAKKAPARRSQRRSAAVEESDATEETVAEKPKRTTRAKAKPEPESKQKDPEAMSKLDALKARQKARAAA